VTVRESAGMSKSERGKLGNEAKAERLLCKFEGDLELRVDTHNIIIVEGRHKSFYPHDAWGAVLRKLQAIARKREWNAQTRKGLAALVAAEEAIQSRMYNWVELLSARQAGER